MRRGPAVLALSLLAGGCSTSTAPGAVGVWRPQLLSVPAARVQEEASGLYARASREARAQRRLNNDAALVGRVRAVAARLLAHVGVFRRDAARWAWQVDVFDSTQLNAFSVPGGRIGVHSGLLVRLGLSDDELAVVLGHEIAHALREHAREKASQGALSEAIVEAISYAPWRWAAPAGLLAESGSVLFVQLPYSREMEAEADLVGLELMARAGYDPRLAAGLWKKLEAQAATSGGASLLDTHPSHEQRIDRIERALPRVMAVYDPARRSMPVDDAATVTAGGASGEAMASSAPAAPFAGGRRPEVGRDEVQARRAATSPACPEPRVDLLERSAGIELYSVACAGAGDRRFVCELGRCTAR